MNLKKTLQLMRRWDSGPKSEKEIVLYTLSLEQFV